MFAWYKGKTPIQKELIASSGTSYALGEALVVSGGVATKCGATVKPEFICASKDFTAKTGDIVVGQRIEEDMEFKTALSATGSSLALGDKVTLDSDAQLVTATTTAGVAQIVELAGTASGAEVVVKF